MFLKYTALFGFLIPTKFSVYFLFTASFLGSGFSLYFFSACFLGLRFSSYSVFPACFFDSAFSYYFVFSACLLHSGFALYFSFSVCFFLFFFRICIISIFWVFNFCWFFANLDNFFLPCICSHCSVVYKMGRDQLFGALNKQYLCKL